jgi:hypothetical protein
MGLDDELDLDEKRDNKKLPTVRESLNGINKNLAGIRNTLYVISLVSYLGVLSYCNKTTDVHVTNMPSTYIPR